MVAFACIAVLDLWYKSTSQLRMACCYTTLASLHLLCTLRRPLPAPVATSHPQNFGQVVPALLCTLPSCLHEIKCTKNGSSQKKERELPEEERRRKREEEREQPETPELLARRDRKRVAARERQRRWRKKEREPPEAE
jgi:hypothetical protein